MIEIPAAAIEHLLTTLQQLPDLPGAVEGLAVAAVAVIAAEIMVGAAVARVAGDIPDDPSALAGD